MRLPIRSALLFSLMIALAALLFFADREYRFVKRASFAWQMLWQSDSQQTVGLDRYKVEIEGQVIEGLEDDVSALSYDPDRKSLFTVTNQKNEMVELSLDGRILRRIPLTGFGDSEAIEYISPGVYVISDERQQRLLKVHVDDNTQTLDAADAVQLTLSIDVGRNKGFEGLAYDIKGQRLFIAKESEPVQIVEIRGFPQSSNSLGVIFDRKRDAGLFVRDMSSLYFDAPTGHLLLMSDESKKILELNDEGRPIASASLKKGKLGLSKDVPQAEGFTLDDEGTLYVVSEPNLFYKFRKP
ncbi:SdiA-regulated domain-containing protein [Pseudomonas sp. KFB-139]|uniref:SdiA-regulated domain-containing protein n=1 Tax=Pseudomonas serbiensis TaxID=3064350 RepID=A0ABT9D1E1_9PSED|nr:SdiA-regulated domain-containing protein [Pseudomonas sp. KFB-138]MDO7930307.1 SdiA-regulated domain-containing protein [Pseudomonas sp. KFB-138]